MTLGIVDLCYDSQLLCHLIRTDSEVQGSCRGLAGEHSHLVLDDNWEEAEIRREPDGRCAVVRVHANQAVWRVQEVRRALSGCRNMENDILEYERSPRETRGMRSVPKGDTAGGKERGKRLERASLVSMGLK